MCIRFLTSSLFSLKEGLQRYAKDGPVNFVGWGEGEGGVEEFVKKNLHTQHCEKNISVLALYMLIKLKLLLLW